MPGTRKEAVVSMDKPKVCRGTPSPEHQPGHTEHGSTPRVASPGLEGPRKPVARTGPLHIFILGHLLPLLNPLSPSAFLCSSRPSHALARPPARSLTVLPYTSLRLCTTSTPSYTRCHITGGFKKARSTPLFPTRPVVVPRKTLLPIPTQSSQLSGTTPHLHLGTLSIDPNRR